MRLVLGKALNVSVSTSLSALNISPAPIVSQLPMVSQLQLCNFYCTTSTVQLLLYNFYCTTSTVQPLLYNLYRTIQLLLYNFYCTTSTAQLLLYNFYCTVQLLLYNFYCTVQLLLYSTSLYPRSSVSSFTAFYPGAVAVLHVCMHLRVHASVTVLWVCGCAWSASCARSGLYLLYFAQSVLQG
jgi:hypothetical protein